nr:MAG TPA: hypothetical protein [Caudoviricetes sp.]
MSVFLELREYGWCVAPGLFTYFWPGVYAYLHHDLTTLLHIVYDCLLLGLRPGLSLSSCRGTKQPNPTKGISHIPYRNFN